MLFTRMVSSLSIRENSRLFVVPEQAEKTRGGRGGVVVSVRVLAFSTPVGLSGNMNTLQLGSNKYAAMGLRLG